ncbi:antA/AntB antirepressor family protein [Corynebacterium diphtheriae]
MGRDLHKFLEVPTRYNDWIGRLVEKYGFIAGQDFCSKLSKSTGGRPSEDHILTMTWRKRFRWSKTTRKVSRPASTSSNVRRKLAPRRSTARN